MKKWILPRLRLWVIWSKLGYNPWHRPKAQKARGQDEDVYMGAREVIPFMNDDAKRTLSHLLLRPGYMMRDYILRGQHERYLSPITALLVFYSVFTLLVAVVKPGSARDSVGEDLLKGFQNATVHIEADSTDFKARTLILSISRTMAESILLTRLDLHPEAADTPWKESLAAVEGDLRSKGFPLFLGSFLLLWMSMAWLLRKRGVNVSGAAAASAYVLCQYCIFMFLALILSFGGDTDLGVLLMGVLLFIDYRQLLGIGNRPAFWLTVKTGLIYVLIKVLFYLFLASVLVVVALEKM